MSSRPPEPPFDPYEREQGGPYAPGERDFDPRERRGYDSREEPVGRRRGPPLWAILAGLVALVLMALFAVNLTRGGPGQDRLDGSSTAGTDKERSNGAASAADPARRCANKQIYDQVKAELFRQAAATRASDKAVFDRLAAYATLRMEAPVLKRQDANVGTLVCSGRASIDLPPGLVVAGGRTSLSAELDYALQNAADGSGQVVTLAGADPITVPLATLARASQASTATEGNAAAPGLPADSLPAPAPAPAPAAPPPPQPIAPAPRPVPVPRAETPPPAPTAPRASASPAFNCRYAKTRGEIAVCNDDGLALLDRRMTSIYVEALREASPAQNALLHRTRDRFLGYRDRCPNNACMAGAYRDRMREIDDIMAGRWRS